MSFHGKTILVTGGSSGIGLATAEAAIAGGAHVVITGRDRDRLDRALSQLGSGARRFAVDASDEKAVRGVFAELPHVDHIFGNADGITGASKLLDTDSRRDAPRDGRSFLGRDIRNEVRCPEDARGPIDSAHVRNRIQAPYSRRSRCFRHWFISGGAGALPSGRSGPDSGKYDSSRADRHSANRSVRGRAQGRIRQDVRRTGPAFGESAEEITDAVLFLMRNGFVNWITLTVDGGALLT